MEANHESVKIVSRDEIRFSIVNEDEEYFSKEKKVFSEFINQIKSYLKDGYDVIADATHLNIKSRAKLLRALGDSIKNVELVAFVLRPPVETSLLQNSYREGTRAYVPPTVVHNMYCAFQMPIEEEGFDEIVIIKAGGN
jgi:predicted kinase